jgi:uncharacterized membrane-anchored protein
MKTLSLSILIAVICAQLAVPFSMIHKKERVLQFGEPVRLLTRPIDPADPFQGRYVVLAYRHDYIPYSEDEKPDLKRKEPIYAIIENGEDGFARFTDWSRTEPASGLYLKTRYTYAKYRYNQKTRKRTYKGIRIDLPFDRFYMEEAKAPRAEKLARDASRSTNCWAVVRILNGDAVIEDVFAEGQSLRDLAAEKEGEMALP